MHEPWKIRAKVVLVDAKEITQWALALPEGERLELARLLVESVTTQRLLAEGVQRIEEIAQGKVAPLTEEQFRAALE